ncbi:MAG: GMP reductase [Alphaproteobacteria bacterium]
MRIENEEKLDFKDVLIRPKRSTLKSRSEVELRREFTFKWSGKQFDGVPIIAANMDGVGTFAMADAFAADGHGLSVALHKHYALKDLQGFYAKSGHGSVWYSIGMVKDDAEKLEAFIAAGGQPDKICIDVANGYSEHFVSYVKQMREKMPDVTIMAGNVVTGEMVEELILAGVDVVKVGIGPGSVCTTRKKTGVGYPQLSAIIECADAAHGLGGLVCGDGGCTVPGDVAKAFAAGADFVMLGGMLAGHDESEQKVVKEKGGEKFLQFYGMSSDTAMKKHKGGVAEYRASEGKTVKIPYRGAVNATLQDILGGVRSTCTYTGARHLKDLSKCTTFVRVTQQLNTVFGNE